MSSLRKFVGGWVTLAMRHCGYLVSVPRKVVEFSKTFRGIGHRTFSSSLLPICGGEIAPSC